MSVDAAETRTRVARIINRSDLNFRAKHTALWNFVLSEEITRGTQFLCAQPGGQTYVILGHSKEVIRLGARGGDRWHAYLNTRYGLPGIESYAKWIYENLRSHASQYGMDAELRRFSMFDQTTRTTYLSAYNGHMWKLDGEQGISYEPIGEDGVFFADDDGGRPCEPDIANHGNLLDRITNLNFEAQSLGGVTPEQQRMAFTVWMFALAFPDLMPTKPLLLLEGAPGAGKTAAPALLQLVLQGRRKAMQLQRNKEDDFGVVLLRSPIALFDNTDAYIDWVPDAVCLYATGGQWTKRKLYTDDESMEIKPHAFICVASKNPASFRREDTADRCIVLRLERRKRFRRFEKLEREILNDRPQLLGEYLWYVNRIVAELRASQVELDAEDETHRMADFAMLASVVGRVLGWPVGAVDDLMAAITRERDAFITEDDPFMGILLQWVDYRERTGRANRGRLITLVELNQELESLAQAHQIQWKHTPNSLRQKIRSPHVDRELRIDAHPLNGTRMYRLWRKDDPHISVLDGGVADGSAV